MPANHTRKLNILKYLINPKVVLPRRMLQSNRFRAPTFSISALLISKHSLAALNMLWLIDILTDERYRSPYRGVYIVSRAYHKRKSSWNLQTKHSCHSPDFLFCFCKLLLLSTTFCHQICIVNKYWTSRLIAIYKPSKNCHMFSVQGFRIGNMKLRS